jgi:hypothetical protein
MIGKMLRRCLRSAVCVLIFILPAYLNASASTESCRISGQILDPQLAPVSGANLTLANVAGALIRQTKSDQQGKFVFEDIDAGEYQLTAEATSFVPVVQNVSIAAAREKEITLQFKQVVSILQSVTVVASSPSLLTPDPAQTIIIHDQVLDANPGRPGAPISIPGLPIETASGGIKAPQYFAPGVAGDHGEPIAQFFQIGNFLYPNNLPANAHGNGYADPNFLIPAVIEAVAVDGGAFNVREGNNSVDLAATYIPTQRLSDFVQITGDYRDADVIGAWGARNPQTNAWLAGEVSFGNGFLERLEHRQQYKLNGLREFKMGRHQLMLFGIGYYGFSFVPV